MAEVKRRMAAYRLDVDGAAVAHGSSCFALNEEGWQRLEEGAARFAIWSVRRERFVVSQEWGKHWTRQAVQQ